MNKGVLRRFREHLPITENTPLFTLGEGETPLIRSQSIEKTIGCGQLYFKLEGCNPTGSFKDRGMVVAVAKAIEAGRTAIACASTGNTSASAAAYGAYCGLKTIVIVPQGSVSRSKISQAIAYGPDIVMVEGGFDTALSMVRQLCQRHPIELVNSVNPNRLEGQKTAAFEIILSLKESPDLVFLPVGNAGNICAYWSGFMESIDKGLATKSPRMMGFQSAGAAPIVTGFPISNPHTIASAIKIGNPASWQGAILARDQSGGVIDMVSDKDIIEAYKLVARTEGIFCEPASAASIAGVIKCAKEGLNLQNSKVVCVLTGTGLKDPDTAETLEPIYMENCPADLETIERELSL